MKGQPIFRKPSGCNAPNAPTYVVNVQTGETQCRCVVCARCNNHTGNSNQGHYWSYCKVTKTDRGFHFCCPNDCQLEEVEGK